MVTRAWVFSLVSLFATSALADSGNRFDTTIFVANKAHYKPVLGADKRFVNAWGIAIRPAGAGGHFWVVAKDISYEYVGDVRDAQDAKLRGLHQDDLKEVRFPTGGKDAFGTGVVFNDSHSDFVITQHVDGAEPITAPAKFLFASDGGLISAWTERKKPDGTFERAHDSVTVIDQSALGAQFFGLALSHDYDTLYVADFGQKPAIKQFDGEFKPLDAAFDLPFDDNHNGKVDAGEYAPFNVQALTNADGDHRIFVAYAKTQVCPPSAVKRKQCEKDALFPGEEDSQPGQGRVAEFDEDGTLIAVWQDAGHLNSPWGFAFAPKAYGALSGALLVSNFGDGTIAAFDPKTRQFIDVLRDTKGKPVVIDKIWGILFGNGQSLGDQDALYFAAGPRDEKDGIFGSLRPVR